MSGPITPSFDPEFFRGLLSSQGRARKPTDRDAERALATLHASPRPTPQARALWTLASYLHEGGEVDSTSLDHDQRMLLGFMSLVIETIHGPRNDSRRALVEAIRRGDRARLSAWLIDFNADHRRLRNMLAEASR
ncbi:hypothetical protein [Microbacterium lacticum]|uniref:hypothetical protein n=1 Tax=Microbacterium lacticum TaxID=33885 RepID=UPI0028D64E77|nr:hypothetical protein [Microbacterium lacticum]